MFSMMNFKKEKCKRKDNTVNLVYPEDSLSLWWFTLVSTTKVKQSKLNLSHTIFSNFFFIVKLSKIN